MSAFKRKEMKKASDGNPIKKRIARELSIRRKIGRVQMQRVFAGTSYGYNLVVTIDPSAVSNMKKMSVSKTV